LPISTPRRFKVFEKLSNYIADCSEIDPVSLLFGMAHLRGTAIFGVDLLKKHPWAWETVWSNNTAKRCKLSLIAEREKRRRSPSFRMTVIEG